MEKLRYARERSGHVIFLDEVEDRLASHLGETVARALISSHTIEYWDGRNAHRFVLALVPDVVSRVGLDEGLALCQEIKDIYNKAYGLTLPR